ncbi:hypothetical protein FCOIX_13899 [Fusarium coicis]|nr:hypothetical protein FCOIX_13899 [Fusarium coicis]
MIVVVGKSGCVLRGENCTYDVAGPQHEADALSRPTEAADPRDRPAEPTACPPDDQRAEKQYQGQALNEMTPIPSEQDYPGQPAEALWSDDGSEVRNSPSGGYPDQPDPDPAEETDTFTVKKRPAPARCMSIQSKLTSIHTMLAIDPLSPLSTGPKNEHQRNPVSTCSGETSLSLELPASAELVKFCRVYFQEHNPYFPCLDQVNYEGRLFEWISLQGSNDEPFLIRVLPSEVIFAAMTCLVCAIAEFIDPESTSFEVLLRTTSQKPGNKWYGKAQSLATHIQHSDSLNLELIRLYTLEAMYLVNVEQLASASRAVHLAASYAFQGGLNDQSSWTGCSATETLSRRRLWWSLYYIDRFVAERSGQPYCIHDRDVRVDDFAKTLCAEQLDPHHRDGQSISYLQGLISWSRMWGQIWDNFFALQAPHRGNQKEIEAIDARINSVRRGLAAEVSWDESHFNGYIGSGEEPRTIRFRLLMFTKFNGLRMVLRHNPLMEVQNDTNAIQLCGTTAMETVNAIVLYMKRYKTYGQLGYFCAATLVDCVYHLAPSLTIQTSVDHRRAASLAVSRARHLLGQISAHRRAATRAARALKPILNALSPSLSRDSDDSVVGETIGDPLHNLASPNADVAFARDPTFFMSGPTEATTQLPEDWLFGSFLDK